MISIKGLDHVTSKSLYIVAYIDGNTEMGLSRIFIGSDMILSDCYKVRQLP